MPSPILDVLTKHEKTILPDWVNLQTAATTLRRDLLSDADLTEQSRRFLDALRGALRDNAPIDDLGAAPWTDLRGQLEDISRTRARLGFSPSETALFVFSLKQPLFSQLRRDVSDAATLGAATWDATALLDRLGLYTIEVFQKGREEVIAQQQQEMLELSTPVVQLWEGILGLPMIGTLDSARTQIVMETLLQHIVDTGAGIAIIDITGVPTVDTLVAQHLLKTVAAARLMGAECIISGIRPQIAQTIVHLGVDLEDVITKATLADAFAIALARTGRTVAPLRRAELSMERIPILKLGPSLIVSIQVDMHDRLAMTLQDDLTERIVATRARGVLIDISALEIVDSFIGRMLGNIAAMARVLDAATVVVGMRPAVAITLVELGLALPGVQTALNVEKGMALIEASMAAAASGANDRTEE